MLGTTDHWATHKRNKLQILYNHEDLTLLTLTRPGVGWTEVGGGGGEEGGRKCLIYLSAKNIEI